MIRPVTARLSRSRSGQPLGYRIEDLSGNVVRPHTRTGVVEMAPAGCFRVDGGVDLPADFAGLAIWGDGREDIAIGEIEPAPVLDITAITRRLDAMVAGLERSVAVGEMASDQSETVAEMLSAQGEDIGVIRQWCNEVSSYSRMASELTAMQGRLDRLFGQPSAAVASPVGELATDERRQYEAQISALQSKLTRAVGAIDRFLVQTGG